MLDYNKPEYAPPTHALTAFPPNTDAQGDDRTLLVLCLQPPQGDSCRCLVRQRDLVTRALDSLGGGAAWQHTRISLGPVQAFKVVNGVKTYLTLPDSQ